MPFNDDLRLRVKRRAHFQCCLCHDLYVEVHHIEPEAEGGLNVEDNAAPLCPSCHEMLGANRTKRKFIREMRDFWYELCAERSKSVDTKQLQQISEQLRNAATKADVSAAFQQVADVFQSQIRSANVTVAQARDATAQASASVLGSAGALDAMRKAPRVFTDAALANTRTAENQLSNFLFEFAHMGDSVTVGHLRADDSDALLGTTLTLQRGSGGRVWELKLTPVVRHGKPMIAVALRSY